jgi:cell division protein FtsW (lipid II flippase)
MTEAFTTVSRFTLLILVTIYMFDSFGALKNEIRPRKKAHLFHRMNVTQILFCINANLVLFLNSQKVIYLILLLAEIIYSQILQLIYKIFFPNCERILVNHMGMLLTIGFIIQSRLAITTAIRQFVIAAACLVLTAFVPAIIRKVDDFSRFELLYAILGIGSLLLVLVAGSWEEGAKLALSFGSIRIQPSELVKITFVLFVASGMQEARNSENEKKIMLIVTGIALLHILILVASRDLGSAAILFVIYLVLYYCYSGKIRVLLLGGAGIGLFLLLANKIFSHVHARIVAWLDPLSVVDTSGYQVSQGLFAMGTGGWFGSGLFQGMPNKIPVVTKDFIFAAIGEEFGGLFAIILIFICLACFILMMNTAVRVRDEYPRLISAGLAVCYGFQLFLSIGGVVKFIPSTGVTMQFISYGGSSLLSTMLMFSIIQGITIRDQKQREEDYLDEYDGEEV